MKTTRLSRRHTHFPCCYIVDILQRLILSVNDNNMNSIIYAADDGHEKIVEFLIRTVGQIDTHTKLRYYFFILADM